MRGRDVLWQPGMDHAGIATQMVVERQMMERQEPDRREIGREKFLEKVWAWKAESGGQIVSQLKRLGASCDWSRERFTMDEGLSQGGHQGLRRPLPAEADLQGQAPRQLGPEAADGDLRSRGAAGRDQGPSLAFPLPDRGRDLRSGEPENLHRGRDDAAGDDARRYRRRGPPGRRALQGSGRQECDPAARRPEAEDRRRQLCRPGDRVRRGEDHAGA